MRDAANEAEAIPTVPTDVLPRNTKSSLSMATSDSARIAELEFENARLQRLVAELVLKNQKLRDCD
jgi:hypothetical protein